MRIRFAVLALFLVAVIGMLAFMFARERGEDLDVFQPLGLLMPLALLAGFVGFYRREKRLRPDLDSGDEDDRRKLLGAAVIKFGCLLFVAAILASMALGLLFGG